jgi:integrase/recombinase XerD
VTPAEFAAIYAQPNPRYPTGARNRAVLAVMYFAGLRVSEAINLSPDDVDDVDPVRPWIHVRDGKGGRDRDLVLTPELAGPIAEWWRARKSRPETASSRYLFCTLKGEPLSRRYIHQMVTRYAAKADVYVTKKVTRMLDDGRRVKVDEEVPAWPHTLRHAFAVNMVEAGAEPPAIQAALGHSSLQTTSVYTAMRAESVRAAVLAGAKLGARAEGPRSQAERIEGKGDRLAAIADLA